MNLKKHSGLTFLIRLFKVSLKRRVSSRCLESCIWFYVQICLMNACLHNQHSRMNEIIIEKALICLLTLTYFYINSALYAKKLPKTDQIQIFYWFSDQIDFMLLIKHQIQQTFKIMFDQPGWTWWFRFWNVFHLIDLNVLRLLNRTNKIKFFL